MHHTRIPERLFPVVLANVDGSLPRESALGRLLFERYMAILDLPPGPAAQHLAQLERLLRSLPRVGVRSGRRIRLRKKERRVMRSLVNWREHAGWTSDPTMSDDGGDGPSPQGEGPKGQARRKTRSLSYFQLGNTRLHTQTGLRYWTPTKEGEQPPYVTVSVEDWLDYEVGPTRPFRPLSGVGGNATMPAVTGILPKLTLEYPALPGKFPGAGQYYEGLPQPKLVSDQAWTRLGIPVNEQNVAPTTSEVTAARDEALASLFAGTPKSRPNFLRALLELKDVRSTVRGLSDLFKWGCDFLRRVPGTPAWMRTGDRWRAVVCDLRMSIAQVSSAYLNTQFGILPTVDDITLFLGKLREGMKVFAEDRGLPLHYGGVVTSHYTVVPREYKAATGKTSQLVALTKTWGAYWYNSTAAKRPNSGDITIGPGDLSTAVKTKFPVIRASCIRGTVFARVKPEDELSDYLKANFGKVGYTWSYPAITTAWELLPWSWLVDWFTDARRRIRSAEKLARSYWMRVAFQEPWYFEKIETRVLVPQFTVTHGQQIGPSRAYFPGYGQGMRANVQLPVYIRGAYSAPSYSRSSYTRGLLQNRPEVPVMRTQCKVNVFRISIGMALIAQAATGSRRFRRWLEKREKTLSPRQLRKRRDEIRDLEVRIRRENEARREDEYLSSFADTL